MHWGSRSCTISPSPGIFASTIHQPRRLLSRGCLLKKIHKLLNLLRPMRKARATGPLRIRVWITLWEGRVVECCSCGRNCQNPFRSAESRGKDIAGSCMAGVHSCLSCLCSNSWWWKYTTGCNGAVVRVVEKIASVTCCRVDSSTRATWRGLWTTWRGWWTTSAPLLPCGELQWLH